MSTTYRIYYTDQNGVACKTDEDDLVRALTMAEQLRKTRFRFVTMVSENTDMVGKQGVDTIVNGKTPDGHDYDWSKADRAGKMRKSDREPVVRDGMTIGLPGMKD